MDVSIVIPIHNERENIPLLYEQLVNVLPTLDRTSEVVLVDDGSTDGSVEQLEELASRDGRFRVVQFRRNFGRDGGHAGGNRICGRRRYCHDGR